MSISMDLLAEQSLPLTFLVQKSDSTLTLLFPHHQNPGG